MERDPLTIVDALAQTSFLVQGAIEARAGEHEISLIQTRLLGVLRDRAPTINELAGLLELDKSSVSGLVVRAEKRGHVVRARSEHDRRSVQVSLTAEGRALVDHIAAQVGAEVLAMLQPLSGGEQQQLVDLLSRVLCAYAGERGIDLRTSARSDSAN